MASPKFTAENRGAILDLLADGLTLKDATREVEIREKTVKGWLTRGRKEEEGDYAEFAAAVDASRADAKAFDAPLTPGELEVVVSRAAKSGSVQAMKLLDEMHRRKVAGGEEGKKPGDPFEELDGDGPVSLDAARQRKSASS